MFYRTKLVEFSNDTSLKAQYYYQKINKLLKEDREKITQNNNVDKAVTYKPILQDMYDAYEEILGSDWLPLIPTIQINM